MISDIPELTCFSLCRKWNSFEGKCPTFGEHPTYFNNPNECSSFEPFLNGDKIKRICGAVGHGCEECYIKCDYNPMLENELLGECDNDLF